MSENKTIDDLRNLLFETIVAVKAGTLDVERAKMVSQLSQVMVNSAKVEVELVKATGGKESAFISAPKPPLPPGITGSTTHRIR